MKELIDDNTGATAIEYGLVVALITLAMLAALQGLATTTTDMWDDTSDRVATAVNL